MLNSIRPNRSKNEEGGGISDSVDNPYISHFIRVKVFWWLDSTYLDEVNKLSAQ